MANEQHTTDCRRVQSAFKVVGGRILGGEGIGPGFVVAHPASPLGPLSHERLHVTVTHAAQIRVYCGDKIITAQENDG